MKTKTTALQNEPVFPTLKTGVNNLQTPQKPTQPLQSLVFNQLILSDGHALWIDSNNNATTQVMSQLAPTQRFLNRIKVARAFTPFQHYTAVETLQETIAPDTDLVILPETDHFYQTDETRKGEGKEMLKHALEKVEKMAENYDIPVLTTFRNSEFAQDIAENHIDRQITCEITEMGPRFESQDFETLVYHGNGWIQTTLEYWTRILEQRYLEDKGGVQVGAN